MPHTSTRPAGLALTCLAVLLAGCASTKTLDETRSTADAAQATFERFMRDPNMTWIQQNLPRAKAVLVSPRVWQAGFIVGGSGGRAVVYARSTSPSGWAGPAFYTLATGSVGLQAGAEAMEMVALVMTDKGRDSLLSSSFKLGGDVSIAAGPVGGGTGAPVTADMVIYTRNKGLYGGVNLSGMVVNVDEPANRGFYGREASPVDILVKRTVSNALATSLEHQVARAAASSGR